MTQWTGSWVDRPQQNRRGHSSAVRATEKQSEGSWKGMSFLSVGAFKQAQDNLSGVWSPLTHFSARPRHAHERVLRGVLWTGRCHTGLGQTAGSPSLSSEGPTGCLRITLVFPETQLPGPRPSSWNWTKSTPRLVHSRRQEPRGWPPCTGTSSRGQVPWLRPRDHLARAGGVRPDGALKLCPGLRSLASAPARLVCVLSPDMPCGFLPLTFS